MYLMQPIRFFPFMNRPMDGNLKFILTMQSLVGILLISIITVVGIKALVQWTRNNNSPIATMPVTLVSKRSEDRRRQQHRSTSYYVTFEDENGGRIEFLVSGSEYGMLAEDDTGDLTFQGTRYLDFDRNSQNIG